MSETGNPIQHKLAATRQWWRTTRALSGLGWTVVAVVVLSLVCYHADSRLVLSAQAREAWRVGIAVAGGALLLAALLRSLLRPLPDAVVAAHVEQKYPALRERLLTAVDLAPALATAGGDRASGFSRSMTAALVEETQKVSANLNFRRAVNIAPLRRASLAALAVLLLMAIEAALAPEAFANWLRRMRDPRADIAPWANTRVYVKPEAELLPRGAGVGIAVITRGLSAEKSVLHYRDAGDKNAVWKTVDLSTPVSLNSDAATASGPTLAADNRPTAKEEIRRFTYRFPSLPQSIEMYASANDGRSNERGVNVEDRPAFSSFKMTFHYPVYTHKPVQTLTVSSGDIAAPAGTEVDVVGIANKLLHKVGFTLNRAAGGSWPVQGAKTNGHLSVFRDASYALALTDLHGFASEKGAPYAIKAQPDQAPTVQISRPATDMYLVPNGSLPITAHATDDYGVAAMRLAYETQKGEGFGGSALKTLHSGALPMPGPNGTPNADINERWHIASIHPQVGETIRYEVDATDNCTIGGAHTARSTSYRIHVVSVLAMQQTLKEALDEEAHAVAELRKNQIEAQKQLEQARQKQDKTALAHAQEAERAVAEEAKSVANRVENLSAQLENNDFATKSELERRNEAKQTIQNLAAQKAPAAADNVKKAQEAKADASQALAQADKQESEIKHDIEKAQEKLSRTPPPEQLAAEAVRLAKEQQDRADTSRTIAEDIKAQQQKNGDKAIAPEDKLGLESEKKNQAEINADTQKLQNQLQQAAKAAAERGNKKQADALKQAAQALQQGQATQHQQEAQKNLSKADPSNAAQQQDKAATALEKAAAAAQQASDNPNGQQATAAQLHQTAKQLQALAEQQKGVAQKTGQNPDAQQSQQLAQQEQAIQKQAQDAQKNLNGAPNAQKNLQNAQQNLQQSGQKLSQNSPQSAQSPAQQAAQQLQQAAQQAENAAQQIEQAQAAAELADRVEHLAQVQKALKDTTARLDASKQRGPLTNNEKGELGQVGQRQQNIEQEAKNLAEKLPSAAFKQALGMAARQAHPATQALNPDHGLGDTGQQTQAAQARAAQTLETIAGALKQQAQGAQNQQQQQQQNGQQQAQSAQQAQEAAALGNLMLAKGLQQQIRQATSQVEQARAHNPNQQLTPAQQQDVRQLTQDQKTTQEITQQAAQDLASQPEIQRTVQQATQHEEQSGNRLQQQQTDQPTQGHQDEALKGLDQAAKQVQQAMQQQQQQQQAQQQAQQGAPQPNGKPKDGNPSKAFTKLEGVQNGQTSNITGKAGQFGPLNPRAQRTLREGQGEKVSAEYQEAVKRYFSALGDKKR